MKWHVAHVYYHAPDKDGLLLDAVRPLLARLGGEAFVLRHWRQGPHLRIAVRTTEADWTGRVRPKIDEIVGGYLREHPSTVVLDPRESLPRHRLLAAREQEPGPLTPWPPDNSIHDAPFDSRRHVLGSDAAVDQLTSFYAESTPLLFAMLDHVRAGRDGRTALAMSLMLTVAHTSHPIRRSYLSFRVHAEGYLAWAADPPAARAAFDAAYQGHRAELIQRVRDVIATLDGNGDAPFVREWAALLEKQRARVELPEPTEKVDLPRDQGELHYLIFRNPAYYQEVFARPDFLRYRVLLNYTYLHLTRLGLTPLDRFRCCHLTANAVEDAYGLSALDVLRRYAGRSA